MNEKSTIETMKRTTRAISERRAVYFPMETSSADCLAAAAGIRRLKSALRATAVATKPASAGWGAPEPQPTHRGYRLVSSSPRRRTSWRGSALSRDFNPGKLLPPADLLLPPQFRRHVVQRAAPEDAAVDLLVDGEDLGVHPDRGVGQFGRQDGLRLLVGRDRALLVRRADRVLHRGVEVGVAVHAVVRAALAGE